MKNTVLYIVCAIFGLAMWSMWLDSRSRSTETVIHALQTEVNDLRKQVNDMKSKIEKQ